MRLVRAGAQSVCIASRPDSVKARVFRWWSAFEFYLFDLECLTYRSLEIVRSFRGTKKIERLSHGEYYKRCRRSRHRAASLPFTWSFFILLFYSFLFLFRRSAREDAGRNDDNWNKHKLLEGSGSFRMVIPIRPERSPPTPPPFISPSSFSLLVRFSLCRKFKSRTGLSFSRVVRGNGIRVFKSGSMLSYPHCMVPIFVYGWKKKLANKWSSVALWHHAPFTLTISPESERTAKINLETGWRRAQCSADVH